jgi:phosphoribosylamine--glycine ligase
LLNLLVGIKNGTFSEKDLHIDKRVAVTVMLASHGYPEKYEKNKLIDLPEDFNESLIFHSGTKSRSSNLYTNGGRVMCVTSLSESLKQALEKSLKVCSKINFDGKYYRKDIGRDLINY